MGTVDRDAEERQLRQRIEKLHAELDAAQSRLDEIARSGEPPRQRHMRIEFRLGAAPPSERAPSVSERLPQIALHRKPRAALERLFRSARGTAFVAPTQDEEADRPVALWIRASSRHIAQLATGPDVEFRAGVFTGQEQGVVLIAIVVRLGPEEPDHLYEAWIDECDSELGGVLEALAEQEVLDLRLYGDDGRLERIIPATNPLRSLAGEARRIVADRQRWSSDVFHEARTVVYKQHPTVRSLWKALKA